MNLRYLYIWTSIICGLVLIIAGRYTNSDSFFQSKAKSVQAELDHKFQTIKRCISTYTTYSAIGDVLKREGIHYYVRKSDSLIYWNENNIAINGFLLSSKQQFSETDGILYLKHVVAKKDETQLFIILLPTGIKQSNAPAFTLFSPDRTTSTSLKLDNSLPRLIQGVLISLYLLGLICAFAAFRHWGMSRIKNHQTIPGLVIFVSGLFFVRLFSLYVTSFISFPDILFFDDTVKPSFLSPSLGDLMINIALLSLLVWFVRSFIRPNYFNNSFSKNIVVGVFNYSLVYISALIMTQVFRQLVMSSGLLFDFEYIFYLDVKSLIALGGILILAISLFILDLHLLRIIRHLGLSPKKRLSANLLALGLLIPVVIVMPIKLPLFLLLGLAGYLTLLDLFIDHFKPHPAWYIAWTITGAILISSLLYQFHMDKEWEQRHTLAEELKSELKEVSDKNKESAIIKLLNKKEIASTYLALYDIKFVTEYHGFNSLPSDPVKNFHSYQDPSHHTLYTAIDERSGFYLSKKSNQLFKVFSFFSYIFIFFNLILFCFTILNRYFKIFSISVLRFFPSRHTLRFRIQVSMLIMSVCSFMLIAFVIVVYIKNNTGVWQQEGAVTNNHEQVVLNEVTQPSGSLYNSYKTFDGHGNLLSNPNERMPYKVWAGLQSNQFQFNRIFNPVVLNGKKYFIQRNTEIQSLQFKRRLNDFLGALLNVYVFLLILIVFISMIVANSIAKPLRILSSKLKQIQIGGSNQRLEWNQHDELGGLIRNYNEMIQELDRSTRLLALTERETAWREMAKQVAHEIKNPLTPMKLITQHLQNSIQRADQEEIPALVKRVTQTLIEQIDNLSKIASEFSNFAKLPAPENEKLVMNEVVTSTHDLFRKREDMDIQLRVPIDEIYVFADKNHIIRVLTNLIKNAIQSIPLGRRGRIEIVLYKQDEKAIVKVTDNGCGIPETMKEKVFYPNFTTKNSGTGLGLAIVRDIIDSCNGYIYFHTSENKGTDFFVELPLMHVADNFREEKRVSL